MSSKAPTKQDLILFACTKECQCQFESEGRTCVPCRARRVEYRDMLRAHRDFGISSSYLLEIYLKRSARGRDPLEPIDTDGGA